MSRTNDFLKIACIAAVGIGIAAGVLSNKDPEHFTNPLDPFKGHEHFPNYAYDLTLLAAMLAVVLLITFRKELYQGGVRFFSKPKSIGPIDEANASFLNASSNSSSSLSSGSSAGLLNQQTTSY